MFLQLNSASTAILNILAASLSCYCFSQSVLSLLLCMFCSWCDLSLHSYLQWWHAWSSRALAACKPPWLPLWSSLCCTLCPTWTQPEPPLGPHNCSGRPLSGSAELSCWESVRGHTSCPVSELSKLNLSVFISSPPAVESVLLKQQFG